MTFGKAAKVVDGIIGGWADAYRVAKCLSGGGQSVLVNAHGQALDLWEGLGWWWVETYELSVERDTVRSLEDLFGNSNSSSSVDSDSIAFGAGPNQVFSISKSGGIGLGTITPSTSLVLGTSNPSCLQIESALDKWLGPNDGARLTITSNKSKGKWVWENIIIESDHTPGPIRKTLISLLTGAKWTPYSSKHETKYYGYLRLMHNPAYLTQRILSTN